MSGKESEIDRVKVLRPTRHKIDHLGDVCPADLLAWHRRKDRNGQKKVAGGQIADETVGDGAKGAVTEQGNRRAGPSAAAATGS